MQTRAHSSCAHGSWLFFTAISGGSAFTYPLFSKHFFTADPKAVDAGPALLREYGIEVLVSFESDWKHMLWKFCSTDTGIPFICSERISPILIEREFWNREGRLALLEQCTAIHELLPCYLPFVPKHLLFKTFVIPNASPEHVPAEYPKHSSESPVLLYLGRFSKEKRPELLLRAFALLEQEFPTWRLNMVGHGEAQPMLQALIQALNLQTRVTIGPAADVWREYTSANIYCLPTLHEGFPNTVLEAMAAGLPIVGVIDCPAMASIIRNGVTGLLAKAPTPEALADVLRPLMGSEKARQRMGHEAWHECKTKYSSALFDQWETILEKIVAENIRR